MTNETAANVIRGRFKTQIAATKNLVTQYDNQVLNTPDNSMWCRFSIRSGQRSRVDIGADGNSRYRTPGVAIAQLFLPIGHGDSELQAMADVIVPVFNATVVSGVTFKTPGVQVLGKTKDSKWWQINVNCPYSFEDFS